ncbi:MAG: class I SAM-dependent methyltransferase [Spirochaetales bacterium]|jgi:ubiquinone/menaquinone biosynthesis C-methylase UbiE|nr:class I SAM-dependent methyltransferase [Spirochaetales bacterium]
MDKNQYIHYNERAWDREVDKKSIWTDGLTEKELQKALSGTIEIRLTTFKPMPSSWIGDLRGKRVLAVGSGGGQQAILFALAGSEVTLLDLSGKQLEQDRKISEQLGLMLTLIKGDMRDLSQFDAESFDIVFNPASTVFIDDVRSFYRGCARVLKPGGVFLTCVANPVLYLFDERLALKNKLKIKYTLPYSDLGSLSRKQIQKMIETGDTFEFSHTLDDLLGGLGSADLVIEGVYSDRCGFELLDSYIADAYLAVRATKRLPIGS